jgi:5-methylcytosine-specific restriction endonuclease McrA
VRNAHRRRQSNAPTRRRSTFRNRQGLPIQLRGGFNVERGPQLTFDVHPIIALRGVSKVNLFDVVPAFGKGKLFRCDRQTCAYCDQRFTERDLQCEHIVPESRGSR